MPQRADTSASVNPVVVSAGCDPSQIRFRETRSLHDAVLRPRRQGAVAVNGNGSGDRTLGIRIDVMAALNANQFPTFPFERFAKRGKRGTERLLTAFSPTFAGKN